MQYITRAIENVLQYAASHFKVVLITGARQTGKSTLIRHCFPDFKEISFDDPFMEGQAKNNPDMFMMLNPSPVFLDEIQYVPELFRYLKHACDLQDHKGQYILSGSQPFKLMELASDSLAGRVAVIELLPFSLREMTGCTCNEPFLPEMDYVLKRSKDAVQPSNVWGIIHRGGYPEIQDLDMNWNMFYASYVKTYLEGELKC